MKAVIRVTCAIALLPSLHVRGAWNDSDVFFESVYRQSDSSGSAADSGTPFAFRATVKNTYNSQVQQLLLPNSAGYSVNPITSFVLTGAHHVFFYGTTSLDDLATKFPLGNYRWSISGTNSNGVLTPSVPVATTSPLTARPQIVDGLWSGGRLRVLASDPRFRIVPWPSPPSGSGIEFELWRAGGAGGQRTSANTTEISWSSQPVGAVFDSYLSFRTALTELDTTKPTGGLFHSRVGVSATLYFQLEMVETLQQLPPFPYLDITPSAELRWLSTAGRTYQVQWSDDLNQWTNLGAFLVGTGSQLTFANTQGGNPRRFFRVQESIPISPTNLVILEARYGADGVENNVKTFIEQNIVNDTVNMTVSNSTLGGDPIFGRVKTLYIRYQNSTGQFQASIQEGGTLRIPDATHQPIP